jgi:acid phosphatase (class A)
MLEPRFDSFKSGYALALLVSLSAAPACLVANMAWAQHFITPDPALVTRLIAAPPPDGSAAQQEELAELHRIEAERTPAQERAARADADEKTVLAFAVVFGPGFSAQNAPATFALARKIAEESEIFGRAAKKYHGRLHPYQADPSLRPACKPKKPVADESYPSGHALRGWLLALTLADLVPEKREAIFARAEDYAHNRLVCGVHYPSDIEASKRLAPALYALISENPQFRAGQAAARADRFDAR